MDIDVEATPEEEERRTLQRIRQDASGAQTPAQSEKFVEKVLPFIESRFLSVRKEATAVASLFFADLLNLQERIIDAAYDLAEDQSSVVRQLGYDFITELSQRAPSWTSRNVDVLAQLLATDDPQDLQAIKNALTRHMTIDPSSTLSILCNYIGSPDATEDLKGTVLAFLIQDANKDSFLQDVTGPASVSFRDGMLTAINRATADELQMIVEELLLPQPLPSEYQTLLIKTILGKASLNLARELDSPNEPLVLFYVDSCLDVARAVQEKQEPRDPLPFLEFYSSSLVLERGLLRMAPDRRRHYVEKLAEAFRASMKQRSRLDQATFIACRNCITDFLDRWLEVILSGESPLWLPAIPLARAVLQRCQDEPQWQPSQPLLRDLLSKATARANATPILPASKEVQAIIKNVFEFANNQRPRPEPTSVLAMDSPRIQTTISTAGQQATLIQPLVSSPAPLPLRPAKGNKRKLEDRSSTAGPGNTSVNNSSSTTALATPVSSAQTLLQRLNIVAPPSPDLVVSRSSSPVVAMVVERDDPSTRMLTEGGSDLQRSSKRPKTNAFPSSSASGPSLLSRLSDSNSSSPVPSPEVPSTRERKQQTSLPAVVGLKVLDSAPVPIVPAPAPLFFSETVRTSMLPPKPKFLSPVEPVDSGGPRTRTGQQRRVSVPMSLESTLSARKNEELPSSTPSGPSTTLSPTPEKPAAKPIRPPRQQSIFTKALKEARASVADPTTTPAEAPRPRLRSSSLFSRLDSGQDVPMNGDQYGGDVEKEGRNTGDSMMKGLKPQTLGSRIQRKQLH